VRCLVREPRLSPRALLPEQRTLRSAVLAVLTTAGLGRLSVAAGPGYRSAEVLSSRRSGGPLRLFFLLCLFEWKERKNSVRRIFPRLLAGIQVEEGLWPF